MQICVECKAKGVAREDPAHIAYTANFSWSSNQGIYKVMSVCLETKQ